MRYGLLRIKLHCPLFETAGASSLIGWKAELKAIVTRIMVYINNLTALLELVTGPNYKDRLKEIQIRLIEQGLTDEEGRKLSCLSELLLVNTLDLSNNRLGNETCKAVATVVQCFASFLQYGGIQ